MGSQAHYLHCSMKMLFLFLLITTSGWAQQTVKFSSNDTALENAFAWAKQQALAYRGDPTDPVGPWYESALPPRYAFCMRDVSHMCIGAEILGMHQENRNMMGLFVKNISASKDWCSYWEINKWGVAAPADYKNDQEFWYNLPANFDVLFACWRLYLWTGNAEYIHDPAFRHFHQRTIDTYIDHWVLQVDSLLTRPNHPHAPSPIDLNNAFHTSRGLPSYSEGVDDLRVGIDLIASIYRALMTFAEIQILEGRHSDAEKYRKKAAQYQQHLDQYWWNVKNDEYYTHIGADGKFGRGEGDTFLFWFDALKNKQRLQYTLQNLLRSPANMENRSYYPLIFATQGMYEAARSQILFMADPSTLRREYPEVSFGVIEGVVQGLMGVEIIGDTIRTAFRGRSTDNYFLQYLPFREGTVSIRQAANKSQLVNQSGRTIYWQQEKNGKRQTRKLAAGKTLDG